MLQGIDVQVQFIDRLDTVRWTNRWKLQPVALGMPSDITANMGRVFSPIGDVCIPYRWVHRADELCGCSLWPA
jgi:hypothetical protein